MSAIETRGSAGTATREMPAPPLDHAAFRKLQRTFRGEIVQPNDASYDEHRRIWNASIERMPAVIARCTSVEDVIAAVRFGHQCNLPVAVRSGGHSFPGHSIVDDGLVIDLRPMNAVAVDPDARTVRAEAGVLLGELDADRA